MSYFQQVIDNILFLLKVWRKREREVLTQINAAKSCHHGCIERFIFSYLAVISALSARFLSLYWALYSFFVMTAAL